GASKSSGLPLLRHAASTRRLPSFPRRADPWRPSSDMSPPHRRVPTAYAAAQAPPTTPLLSNHRRELWRRKQSNMKSFCSGRLVRRLGFGVKQSEVYEPGGDDCRIPVIECVYEWIQRHLAMYRNLSCIIKER
uniref:Uncharacterized protein n=1 Tax=Aegilops tauschii subsp. strangulata TaxID=200361 RepID=A0A453NPP1_AEGTS